MIPHEVTTWRGQLLNVLLSAFVMAAVIVVLFLVWPNDPPVQVISRDTPLTRSVCPGEALNINNLTTVKRPTVLFLYVSVMDEHANFNIPGTVDLIDERLHPHASSFPQHVPWTVPSLPPGKYVRNFTVLDHDTDRDPLPLLYPFTVGEDC